MRVAVDPGALAEWSADAHDVAGRLRAGLDELRSAVAPLAATWDGAAAAGFDQHYGRWQVATGDLLGTLAGLVALVDTARGNYTAASTANARIWSGAAAAPVGPAVVHTMSLARPAAKIDAETDDIRATVTALASAADSLCAAWVRLAGAVGGAAAMAGDDAEGVGLGGDIDAMAAAAWQAWRSAAILLGAVCGGLAATGNNLIRAEADSTSGGAGPPPLITAAAVPVPVPAVPPGAVGGNGSRSFVDPLAGNWPAADPARLRAAAAAWRGSAESVRDVAGQAGAAVAALVEANPDPTLAQMRSFTDRVLSLDPAAGLLGALAVACGDIAGACDALAAATDRARRSMADAVAAAVTGEEWYDPVAAVLDAVLTRGAAKLVAAGGHAAGLAWQLGWIHTDHAAAVRLIRAEVSPAAVDHLARLATALVPPTPLTAATCAVTSPAAGGAPVAEADRQALLAQAQAEGRKLNPAEVLQIARAPDGRIVWLERGNEKAGLAHILRAERMGNFIDRGIPLVDIPTLPMRVVMEGTPVGRVGRDGVAYDVVVDGRTQRLVVVIGSNGYIVSTYPLGDDDRLRPM